MECIVIAPIAQHAQISHLGAKNIPYQTAILAILADSLLLTHTLSLNGPCFLGPVGTPGVRPQI